MERSEIRVAVLCAPNPDFASLHPGCGAAVLRSVFDARRTLRC